MSDVQRLLHEKNLDAQLISSVSNITYLTGFSNFSRDQREAYLLILKNKQYIFTDARYSEAIKNSIKDFTLVKISGKNPFASVLKTLTKKHNIKRCGLEEDDLTVAESKRLYPCIDTWIHCNISSLRQIKNPQEIQRIKKACQLGDEAFAYILNKIKPGVTEKELAFELEFFMKGKGHDISFKPIVAFGKNSAVPHHQTNNQSRITGNSLILLDFGAKVDNYCSDMTRTVFFGKANPKQKKMYQTVLEAQKKAIEYINKVQPSQRLNLAGKNVDKIARDYIIANGYPSIPHSLGHSIGIDVHEKPTLSPQSKDILKTNMIFSVEPGIYIQSFGGVRIEDDVLLTDNGPEVLTKSPKALIEL